MTLFSSIFNARNLGAMVGGLGVACALAQPAPGSPPPPSAPGMQLQAVPARAERALPPAIPRRPNIIVILADGLGYGDLGSYGQRNIKTPNLDALAAGGAKLNDYYAGSPVGFVSRQTMMVGHESGRLQQSGTTIQTPNQPNIAELLKAAGYRTGCLGLWGLSGLPQHSGFDEWLGFLTEDEARATHPRMVWRFNPGSVLDDNGKLSDYDGQMDLSPTPKEPLPRSATEIFTTAAVNFIKIRAPDRFNKFQPFFLLVSYAAPREAPTNDISPYGNESWPLAEKAKAAAITRLDADVGRILEGLRAARQESNTVLVITSSGGPKKDGGVDPVFHRSAGGLRLSAPAGLHEGDLRVPCLIYGPGKIGAGKTTDEPWAAWDVLPTLTEIGMAHPPADLDGISLLPWLTGGSQTNHHEHLHWGVRKEGDVLLAIRAGDWKAIKTLYSDKPAELYNLKNDAAEKADVAKDNPEELGKFEAYIKENFSPTLELRHPKPTP